MKEISLTRGLVALVDDADFDELSKWKWHAFGGPRHWYAARKEGGRANRRVIRMHRVLTGAPAGMDVDHADGNTLNNQRANLRVCSRSDNQANRGPSLANPCGFKGVCHDRGAWVAKISRGGVRLHLGRFKSPEEAARAYDAKAKELHGEFGRLNFPEGA